MKLNQAKHFLAIIAVIIFGLIVVLPAAAAGKPPAKSSAAADIPQNWLARVQQDIATREYYASPGNHKDPAVGKTLQAPNRRQNLRTWFTPSGILVQRRVQEDNPWAFKLQPETAGVAGKMHKLVFDKPRAAGSRVTYPGKYMTQWFENRPEGLEQGFTIPRSLGKGELLITLKVEGNLKPTLKNPATLELATPQGVTILEYGHLKVTDANQKNLSSSFSLAASRLTIHIDTAGAVYPLTVDPLLTSQVCLLAAEQKGDWFGYSVSTAGDVNHDGYDDVIVGSPYYDNGQANEGAVFVYQGSAGGVDSTHPQLLGGDQVNGSMGYSVSAAGDVNGDGFDDVIVGAPYYDNGEIKEGVAFVYLGSSTGLNSASPILLEANHEQSWYGFSVSTAGDVNGDGYDDIIVGAPLYDNGETNEGAAFVYQGTSGGLNTNPAWHVESDQADAQYGYSVSTAGDVDDDGIDDVIVGALLYTHGETNEGVAFVYMGAKNIGLDTNPACILESDQAGAAFGSSVSGAGDVNGDGIDDVIVGADHYNHGETSEGAAFIYRGAKNIGLATIPTCMLESNQTDALFGSSVSTAGDVNGDGFDDVIVGAPRFDNGETDEGAAFVYMGATGGLNSTYAQLLEPDQEEAWFGTSLSEAGDVNGDGCDDVIVGAYNYNHGVYHDNPGDTLKSVTFVYMGSNIGLSLVSGWHADVNQDGAHLGYSVSTAGDINDDNYDDVIIGAPDYDSGGNVDAGKVFSYLGSAVGLENSFSWSWSPNLAGAHFGYAVSTAGDVNDDNYADIIVGAPDYAHGETGEGAVFIFPGTSTGIFGTPWPLESDQADAHFGYAVSAAGDINNDGYDDVIVGAPDYDHGETDEGAVFIYLGTGTLSDISSPSWALESNNVGAQLGFSVSAAGDINGDNFPDIVAGAPDYSNGENNEGAAFVWHGMTDGLNVSPLVLESNQGGAHFGYSVSTAGDINKDGYADVIVGAPGYDNDEVDEGAVFLYPGSGLGLIPWIFQTLESNLAHSGFGWAVAGAGDIDRDGYNDVIVGIPFFSNGETNEGAVAIYTGSPNGVSFFPSYGVESNQEGSYLGSAVAGAGDVNGDLCADVIIGAPYFDNGEADEGCAFIFYGINSIYLYVSSDGVCNNFHPCFITIDDAYQSAITGQEIRVRDEVLSPSLVLGKTVKVSLRGGWNDGYSSNVGTYSTIEGSVTISAGTVIIDGIIIE